MEILYSRIRYPNRRFIEASYVSLIFLTNPTSRCGLRAIVLFNYWEDRVDLAKILPPMLVEQFDFNRHHLTALPEGTGLRTATIRTALNCRWS